MNTENLAISVTCGVIDNVDKHFQTQTSHWKLEVSRNSFKVIDGPREL